MKLSNCLKDVEDLDFLNMRLSETANIKRRRLRNPFQYLVTRKAKIVKLSPVEPLQHPKEDRSASMTEAMALRGLV